MPGTRSDEVERKYAVDPGTPVPDLTGVGGVAAVGEGETHRLVATYFDTEALDLLRNRMTLRRRVGGSDEGWHLKRPGGRDRRTETRLPLGRAVHTVPKALRETVAEAAGGARLLPVATVTTLRVEHPVTGPDGEHLAVLCVDDVRAERLLAPAVKQRWVEWEVELVDAPHELLDRIEPELRRAGAVPATVSSKVARALAAEPVGDVRAPEPEGLDARRSGAADVLRAYLAEHLDGLRRHESGLQGETVHRLRVSARRLRSALTSYRPVLEAGAVDDLRDELRWLGGALGDARDAEVLRGHLMSMVDTEPDAVATRALRERLERDLGAAHRAGREAAAEAVASERYAQLLRTVEAVVAGPPVRDREPGPAGDTVARLLQRDVRRVRRAAKAAREAAPGRDRDRALHEVRKRAKRLRYAAESARPVLGKRAAKLANRARDLQDALGTHQDTVASRAWLVELASRADGRPDIAFGAGRLHAREEQRARESEQEYAKAYDRLPRRRVARWVLRAGS